MRTIRTTHAGRRARMKCRGLIPDIEKFVPDLVTVHAGEDAVLQRQDIRLKRIYKYFANCRHGYSKAVSMDSYEEAVAMYYRINCKVDNLTNSNYFVGWSTTIPQMPVRFSANRGCCVRADYQMTERQQAIPGEGPR